MGWFDGLFERKAAAPSAAGAIARATGGSSAMSYSGTSSGVGLGQVGGWDIDKAVKDGVEKVIWVFRAVDVIAQNQAGLPIERRRGMDRAGGEIVEDKPLWRLLNFRCNVYETSWQLRYRLSAVALLARRGAFIEIVPNRLGGPAELHIIPPGTCEPIPHPTKFVSGYRVRRSDYDYDVLPPERVIWFRLKPHPTDPYAQLTPLMSAGIHADTDFLANLFNRQFLANDGRPGMLINIKGQISPQDAEEIKNRFSGGPMKAGEASVIESDGIDVADMSASPRDVQWENLLSTSKERLLMAFGVPESVMGNASGRTFDNADAERENFWMDTMMPHCNNIASALDLLTGDINDEDVLAFNYEGVDVLQRAIRLRREEYRTEVQLGLRTIDEYFEATGREKWDVPGTRLLILPSGVALGRSGEDQAAVTQLQVIGQPAGALGAASEISRQGALAGAREAQRQLGNIVAARALMLSKSIPAIETKAAEDIIEAEVVEEKVTPQHPYLGLRARMEGELEGLLAAWDTQQEAVITDRLMHVKMRKGTRHWDGEQQGEVKALNPAYAVEVDRWVADLKRTMQNSLRKAIAREAGSAARDMDGMGVLKVIRPNAKGTPLNRAFNGIDKKEAELTKSYDAAMAIVDAAARRQSQRIMQVITDMDAQGKSMKQIEKEVRRMIGIRSQWRKSLAINVVTTAVEGARTSVYMQAKSYMEKTWNTEGDERVRHTHARIDGQTRRGTTSFKVGRGRLQFPSDPTGPIEEVMGCRCWLEWSPSDSFYDEGI